MWIYTPHWISAKFDLKDLVALLCALLWLFVTFSQAVQKSVGVQGPATENSLGNLPNINLYLLPQLTDCPCKTQGGFLLRQTQKNYAAHQFRIPAELQAKALNHPGGGCRKSIIYKNSTCVFREVKHCTQTDMCPSLGCEGGVSLET